MLIALALLQAAATPPPAPSVPQRFSILVEPCAPVPEKGRDVVVCGTDLASSQRLPLPDEAEPTVGYAKPDSMDYRDNKGGNGACVVRGCQVGFGPPIMPAIIAGVKAIGNMRKDARWAAARKRDGARRVAIPLDAAPPAGRIER